MSATFDALFERRRNSWLVYEFKVLKSFGVVFVLSRYDFCD